MSTATDEAIESLRDAIAPIYEPVYDPVEGGGWLKDEDLVIGIESLSGAYAYPIKILNFHEIVNDLIDDVPVLISYCPLCASAVVYDRALDGQVLVFGNTSALHESDMVMYDHQTGSYWFQVIGEAIVGPLTGKRLEMLPSVTVTWAEWKSRHPDTSVLSRDLGFAGGAPPYERDPFVGYSERVNNGQFIFPVTEEKLDGRLSPGDMVFAIQVGESHKAYRLDEDSDWLLNDTVGGKGVVVMGSRTAPSAAAYFSQTDDRTLTFKLDSGAIEDLETGSTWNSSARAVSGSLAGTQLMAVPSRTSFWFSLVGALPGIELQQPE